MNELFPNFINDAAIYNAAEITGKMLSTMLLVRSLTNGLTGLKILNPNGTPIQNGNPILS